MLASPDGTTRRFSVRAPDAASVWLCPFDDADRETRVAMDRDGETWVAHAPIVRHQRYGFRAAGPPPFDPAKLLVDPYATHLDRPFEYDARLAMFGADTAALVPKAVVVDPLPPVVPAPPVFRAGGLIYELNVRGFTNLHLDLPPAIRGTVSALAHPAVIEHLRTICVDAVELMPIVAWIDERHLPPLGLRNAWGYNPVVPMALDPRLCPGGMAELRDTVATLRGAGIGVILDLVFNHTGESDAEGPTLSLRGLDDRHYARAPDGALINDTGTGNTLDFGYPPTRDLVLATLRHFVGQAGVDGFRFDLATVLARSPGFAPDAPIFAAIAADPLLADRIMIAEPWDIGPGGYRLGQFPASWLEWNDRYRDDVRRFWRGDGSVGALATRLAGSTDIFGDERTRSVNFMASHDGFTLADTVRYATRHNEANGESNRDGHAHEVSWISATPGADVRALLATLFASRGTIMIAAGDEMGRTQHGNNNAYAQDNATSWIDWGAIDHDLVGHVAHLAQWRRAHHDIPDVRVRHDIRWSTNDGQPMAEQDWSRADGVVMRVAAGEAEDAISFDRPARRVTFS
ncbi:glycogen-debranching protein [Sphingomonas sp. TZW2008]|uniref:glycogen debranching protein n=1 Tax=Sphingomonas sp. TZW2008 TaxID=1917973 RepID=UPI000A26FB0D|nr:glycogen debranching enzyme [Sphingomonas sp. TZW2008]